VQRLDSQVVYQKGLYMELRAKGDYHSPYCSMYSGDCTDQYSIPEEVKVQMLADFPDLFEMVGGGKVSPAAVVDVDPGVEVENQEAKMPKIRKK